MKNEDFDQQRITQTLVKIYNTYNTGRIKITWVIYQPKFHLAEIISGVKGINYNVGFEYFTKLSIIQITSE